MSKISLKEIRKAAWIDPLYFIKNICGWDKINEVPHREMIEFILGSILNKLHNLELGFDFSDVYCFNRRHELPAKNNKFLLVPRNTFKTTIISSLILWLLWRCPNIRILLVCETYKKATDILAGIKTLMKNGELLRKICVNEKGDYLLEMSKAAGGDTERQLILKTRTRLGLKEPSVWCEGADGSTTGQHPNVIIFDDLVSITNIKTEARRNSVEEVFRQAQSLAEIGASTILLTGTRYHNDDLYGRVLARNKKEPTFDLYIRPAFSNPEDVLITNADNTTEFRAENLKEEHMFFPSHLSKEFLEDVFKNQGMRVFSNQYMLDTTAAVENALPFHKIDFYQEGKYSPERMTQFSVLSDFAYVKSDTADRFAVIVLGIDENGHWWIPHIYAEREGYTAGVSEMVDIIVNLYEAEGRKLKRIVTEVNSAQRVVSDMVKDLLVRTSAKRLARREIFFEHSPKGDKKARIMLLEPLMLQGKIHIAEKYRDLIVEECKNVASDQNGDDVLDAMCKQLLFPHVQAKTQRQATEQSLEQRIAEDMRRKLSR